MSPCIFCGASTSERCLPLVDFTGITVKFTLGFAIASEERAQFPVDQPARATKMGKSPTRVLLLTPFDIPALFHITLLIFYGCGSDCCSKLWGTHPALGVMQLSCHRQECVMGLQLAARRRSTGRKDTRTPPDFLTDCKRALV